MFITLKLKLLKLVNFRVGPAFAAITASTLLGRCSTRWGIFDHSSRSVFVRSHTDVGWKGLALGPCSSSSERRSTGSVEVRILCRLVKFIHTRRSHLRLYGPCSVHWCTVMLEQEGSSQNCSHKVRSMYCPTSLGMLKHSEFLSLELRGQAQLLKNNPTP